MSSFNERRAAHGQSAFREYLKIKGDEYSEPDECDNICDLISDLLHFAESKGYDIDGLHSMAYQHWQDETADDCCNEQDEG